MLAGAPVFVAQLDKHKAQAALSAGNKKVLEKLNMARRGSAAELIQVLRQAPPASLLNLVNSKCGQIVTRSLARAAESLDYTQSVLNVLGTKPSINPVTNAVSEAFLRRRFAGSFNSGNHSVELDTLLNETTG